MNRRRRNKHYDRTTGPSPAAARRRLVAMLGVVLLALKVVTGGAVPLPVPGFHLPQDICSAHGPATPEPAQQPAPSAPCCDCCLPHAGPGLAGPAVTAFLVPPLAAAIVGAPMAAPDRVFPARWPTTAAPRAPPAA